MRIVPECVCDDDEEEIDKLDDQTESKSDLCLLSVSGDPEGNGNQRERKRRKRE